MIRLVSLAEIDAIWPALHEGMERACRKAHSSYSAIDFYRLVRGNGAFLHIVEADGQIKAGIITEIGESSEGKYVKVLALCGFGMGEWLSELIADPFWEMAGVKTARWEGRIGLEKIPGAKVIRQVYELPLGSSNAG